MLIVRKRARRIVGETVHISGVREIGCVGYVVPFDSRTPDEVKRLRDNLYL